MFESSSREEPRGSIPPLPETRLPSYLPGSLGPPRWMNSFEEGLTINPRFAALIPPPTPAEWATTLADILAVGIRDFLFIWAGKRQVLDGNHRWPVIQEHRLSFPCREVLGLPDEDACEEWIKKASLPKKSLSFLARSDLRGQLYNVRKRKQGGDHKSAKSNRHNGGLISAAEMVASECGGSKRTVERDGEFAASMDQIEANCGREARGLLLRADFKFAKALLVGLSEESAAVQQEFVDLVREGKAAEAKESRKLGRPRTITVPRELRAMIQALKKKLTPDERALAVQLFSEA